MPSSAEAGRGVFAKATTQPSFTVEQKGLFAPAPSWELIPGKRIPIYITRLADESTYRHLSIRLPAMEKYAPQYDMYRVTLPPKAEPHRHPIVEKRFPTFWTFRQLTNTKAEAKGGIFAGKVILQPSFATARHGVFAPSIQELSSAKAKPGVFAPALPSLSKANAKPGVFAPAA